MCVKCYITETNKELITDIVAFIPRQISIPNETIDSHLTRTANNHIHLLDGKQKLVNVTAPNSVKWTLIQITILLKRDDTSPIDLKLPNFLVISKGAAA